MKRATLLFTLGALFLALLAAPAQAAFGFKDLDVTFTREDGGILTQAGEHPFEMISKGSLNTAFDPVRGFDVPEEDVRDLTIFQIPGLVGSREAVPTCPNAIFLGTTPGVKCPPATVVGVIDLLLDPNGNAEHELIYNIAPPPGVAAKLGFEALQVPITLEATVNPDPPYNVIAKANDAAQVLSIYSVETAIWGVPADKAHDAERGGPAGIDPVPFLTLPRSCEGPLPTVFEATSWQGSFFSETIETHGEGGVPQGMTGCGALALDSSIAAQPTTRAAESPTGLDFSLRVKDEGLTNPDGRAGADVDKAVVTLPEGMTANPSVAEGLEVCTEAQLDKETPSSPAGAGCPGASKIGTVDVRTPLLSESLTGSLYVAEPHKNPFGSLIALYMVIKSANVGVIVEQPLEVTPDPVSGRLIVTASDIPSLPFSEVNIHLREGARSPLISPPRCGEHTVQAKLYPSSGAIPVDASSSFELISGPGGGACPPGGTLPFEPGFEAGSLNNAAGAFSPFFMRLTRRDGDQGMERFSVTLPRGVIGSLVGVERCPEAGIAAAAAKSGKEEQAVPSCPASSRIGSALGGAGVGSQLTYVRGDIYLAGSHNGAPLSVVAIVPAVAGPFDVGNVVVRQALQIDSRSAQVTADGSRSDPIPSILAGIPLRVRDIRVHVDRPNFTSNPTSCDPAQVEAGLSGSEGAFARLSTRFQAAGCSDLGFAPRLALSLRGGTKRGGHPALTAVLRPRPGDANIARASATLPRSEFLDQAHIRTVCTRVQFAADACPPGAIYGRASATTPLLDVPVTGPVYLRSSDNLLPDLVVDLHGPPSLPVRFEVVGRTDSIRGGIRNTFEATPDVPVSKFVLRLQGGRKGLLVNSTDICTRPFRARVKFHAHNGKRHTVRPRLRATGC